MKQLYPKYGKRLVDLVISGMVLILTLPLFLAFSLMLWIEKKKSIFFVQNRLGLNEQSFNIVKFKTTNDRRDIYIIWLTIVKNLKREDINQSELRPMQPFKGQVK